MDQMDFSCKWRRWIKGCLSSGRASILINGSATKEFDFKMGVRQGDPLAPFLFILAMEGLSLTMREACEQHSFHEISLPNGGPTLSHLMYADDVTFIGEWSEMNLINLNRILRCFYLASGLKVNLNKSRVFGVGVEDAEIANLAGILNCESGTFPFTYLGLPLGANMRIFKHWNPILEKFRSRLSVWKAKNLSFAGRLTLLKSRTENDNNSMWLSCIKAWHNIKAFDGKPIAKASLKGKWWVIAKVQKELEEWNINLDALMERKIGNGNNTHFWKDRWLEGEFLKVIYPELYKRELRRDKELNTMEELKNKLNSVSISSLRDSWRWNINANGTFSVQSLRMRLVDNMANGVMTDDFRWITWLPLKINYFVWRLMLNRIPLSNNLSSKGIQVTSHQCKMCLLEDANMDHVFFRCEYALSLWLWLCNWSGLMDVAPIDFVSFSTSVNSYNGDVETKKMFLSLGYTVLWLIWKERNERFFGRRIKKAMQLANDIQLFAFNWIKNRGNIKRLDWTETAFHYAGRNLFKKAIREDCPPGKEEGKKALSSISTSFPRRWKSRPAQRITGAIYPFVSTTKKSSLTISHSFPGEPPLFAIRCLYDMVVDPSLCSCVILVAFDGVSMLGISSGSPPLLGVLGAEVFLTILPLMMSCASALVAVFVCLFWPCGLCDDLWGMLLIGIAGVAAGVGMLKKQTVFLLQTADVWATSSSAEFCRCGPQTADILPTGEFSFAVDSVALWKGTVGPHSRNAQTPVSTRVVVVVSTKEGNLTMKILPEPLTFQKPCTESSANQEELEVPSAKSPVKNEDEENDLELHCAAQDALVKVHDRIVEEDIFDDEESVVFCRMLVPNNTVGCLLGKGGEVIKRLRGETGAVIRLLPADQLPTCAMETDELLQISGIPDVTRKALAKVSTLLHQNPRKDEPPSNSRPVGAPRSFHPGAPPPPPERGPYTYGAPPLPWRGYGNEPPRFGPPPPPPPVIEPVEDTPIEFPMKILCGEGKIGGVVGRNGISLRQFQQETGTSISVEEPLVGSDERVILVSSFDAIQKPRSRTIDAILLLQDKTSEHNEKGLITTRVLIPSSKVGCILGQGGMIINEMRRRIKADIRVYAKEEKPICAGENEELVQVSGSYGVAKEALAEIASRFRARYLRDTKPPPEHAGPSRGGHYEPIKREFNGPSYGAPPREYQPQTYYPPPPPPPVEYATHAYPVPPHPHQHPHPSGYVGAVDINVANSGQVSAPGVHNPSEVTGTMMNPQDPYAQPVGVEAYQAYGAPAGGQVLPVQVTYPENYGTQQDPYSSTHTSYYGTTTTTTAPASSVPQQGHYTLQSSQQYGH
ncbi:hypothetical protein LXL04_007088 [Taraxacum kok-saghyz]